MSHAEEIADAKAVLQAFAEGRPIDSESAARVRQESERIKRVVFEKHGPLDVAVSLIRELRDE